MKKHVWALLSTMMVIPLVLSACGSTGSDKPDSTAGAASGSAQPAEPVTLKVAVIGFANHEFDSIFSKMAAEKFPNVTLEKIKLVDLTKDIVVPGTKADILLTGLGAGFTADLKSTGLGFDMSALAKAGKLDLSKLDQARLDLSQNSDGNPDLTMLPFEVGTSALYYNKDLFDRFGVTYPKDHMTWAQITDLAKRLTRTANDVSYRGLEPDAIERPASQRGLDAVDPKTNKAAVNTDGWKAVFTQMKDIYDIPGNISSDGKLHWYVSARNEFSKTKDLAMLAGQGPDGFDTIPDLNWDMASYPVTDPASDISQRLGGKGFAITSVSEHKDAAFQLIQYWLSAEVQKKLLMAGYAPALSMPDAQKDFGADLPGFKGKHVEALFMTKSQLYGVNSEYEPAAIGIMDKAFQDMIINHKDVNTVLRSAEDDINKTIDEAVKSK